MRPYNENEIVQKWEEIRNIRNKLLFESDWTQIGDFDMCIPNKQDWIEYRQILRDIPEVQTNPFDITWPTPPN